MIKINLSTEKQAILMDLHQNHIHQIIRQRAHVLLLRSEGILNNKISSITIDYISCFEVNISTGMEAS
ncbi:MAG: hypothetical protein Q8R24_08535 [Legionellaceae bacterium]|nr:hypothetical protein [Legionellaceae bacterium]